MPALDELLAHRGALVAARYSGLRRVEYDGRSTEYRSDAELKAALEALDEEIRQAGGGARITTVRFATSKGV